MLEQEVEVSRSPSKYRARRLASWLRTRLSWHQTPTRSRGALPSSGTEEPVLLKRLRLPVSETKRPKSGEGMRS